MDAAAPKIDVSIEKPGVQQTSLSVDNKETETFDDIPEEMHAIWKSALRGIEVAFRNFVVHNTTDNREPSLLILNGFEQRLPLF